MFSTAFSDSQSAKSSGIFFNSGFKNIKTIPKILKNKWANPATIAVTLRVNEANNAVTVVPTFAPIVKGYN